MMRVSCSAGEDMRRLNLNDRPSESDRAPSLSLSIKPCLII